MLIMGVFFYFVRGPPYVLRFLNINQKFGRTGNMKIEYKFATGEKVYVDVNEEFEDIMIELDNELKNNNRRETRRHESLNLLDKDKKIADMTADVLEDVLKKLDIDKLYDAIAKLKPNEQEIIHNLYLCRNPISQVELARTKNVSIGSIKMQLHRIKNKLKKSL